MSVGDPDLSVGSPNDRSHEAEHACSAYRDNDRVCANGFIQVASCWRLVRCFSCGAISKRVIPHCLQDELPAYWLTEGGRPLFVAEGKSK